MLESLEISAFRGIRTGKLDDLSQVNIFIGPNGSGKSTILEALTFVAAWYFRSDILGGTPREYMHARRHDGGNAPPGMWYGRPESGEIRIQALVGGSIVSFWASRSPSEVQPGQCEPHSLSREAAGYLRKLLFLDAARALTTTVEGRLWDAAFLAGVHKTLLKQLEAIYGVKATGITYSQRQEVLLDLEPRPLRLDDLGAGMRIAFRILLAAVMTEGSALLLEEFDAYQYKTSLDRLALALCQIAGEKNVQLLLTTHSLETVHSFLEAAEGRQDDWIKVFPLSLSGDGVLATRGLPRADAAGLMASGLDLRDITAYARAESAT